MQRTVLVLLASVMLSACASEGKFVESDSMASCGGHGGTFINLHYGDSELSTNPIAHVRPGGDFEIRLKPKRRADDPAGVNYEEVGVNVAGKPSDPAAAWITASGSYDDSKDHKLVICVDPNQPEGDYNYEITVDHVGFLDPRVDVF